MPYFAHHVLCLVALAALFLSFVHVVVRGRVRNWARGPLTALFSLAALFLVLELVFLHLPSPHTGGNALAEQLWLEKYWNPINELKFRDFPVDQNLCHRDGENVLFVGDSFTAGHGVTFEETLPYLFRERAKATGTPFNVFNLGRNGADTKGELRTLRKFPVKPNVTVLQYFINDVDAVAHAHGVQAAPWSPYSDVPALLRPIVRSSYFVNYLYWLVPRTEWASAYYDVIDKGYETEAIFAEHKADLTALYEEATHNGGRAIFLIYPLFVDDDRSRRYLAPVYRFLDEAGYPYLAVQDLTDPLPVAERVAGANDAHPSPQVHRLVMDALWTRMQREDWIDP